MTWLDKLLRQWRLRMAVRELPVGARVLDIGTHDGALFASTGLAGVGIDPEPGEAMADLPAGVRLIKGFFPDDLLDEAHGSFQAATALAVVEHVPEGGLQVWAAALSQLLSPGGVVVITVPAPAVDKILHVLMRLHLVAGMEAHQHHGFQPGDLDGIFTAPDWQRRRHRIFQLGLNHLYVFVRT